MKKDNSTCQGCGLSWYMVDLVTQCFSAGEKERGSPEGAPVEPAEFTAAWIPAVEATLASGEKHGLAESEADADRVGRSREELCSVPDRAESDRADSQRRERAQAAASARRQAKAAYRRGRRSARRKRRKR